MCGIIGMVKIGSSVAPDLVKGLKNLRNRGQEGSGIAVAQDETYIKPWKGKGSVEQAIPLPQINLDGYVGIGQNRYSTTGPSSLSNLQPIEGYWCGRDFYLVHNGNVVNLAALRNNHQLNVPVHYSDTRIIALLVSQTRAGSFEEAIVKVAQQLRGSFNLIFLFDSRLYVIKDRFGFHPLQLAKGEHSIIVASESHAFYRVDNATLTRDIEPGEMVIVCLKSYESFPWTNQVDLRFDIFEFIYYLFHRSMVHGVKVSQARERMGWYLADAIAGKASLANGVVIPLPESGNQAAQGLYEKLSLTFPEIKFRPRAIYKDDSVGRTFITPGQLARVAKVELKFDPDPDAVAGQSVLLIDDSLIRGTVSSAVVRKLRQAGAKEVHLAVTAPQYRYPCYYGIDTYRNGERLISQLCNGDTGLIAEMIGADSVTYLGLEKLIQAILDSRQEGSPLTADSFYAAPFTGIYPDGICDYEC